MPLFERTIPELVYFHPGLACLHPLGTENRDSMEEGDSAFIADIRDSEENKFQKDPREGIRPFAKMV